MIRTGASARIVVGVADAGWWNDRNSGRDKTETLRRQQNVLLRVDYENRRSPWNQKLAWLDGRISDNNDVV